MALLLLPPRSLSPFPAARGLVPAAKPCSRVFASRPRPPGAVSAGDAFTEKSGYLFELSVTEADSLTEYDVPRMASIYKRRPFILLRRLLQIGTTFGRWFALRYLDSVNDRSDEMFKVHIYRPSNPNSIVLTMDIFLPFFTLFKNELIRIRNI